MLCVLEPFFAFMPSDLSITIVFLGFGLRNYLGMQRALLKIMIGMFRGSIKVHSTRINRMGVPSFFVPIYEILRRTSRSRIFGFWLNLCFLNSRHCIFSVAVDEEMLTLYVNNRI